MKKLIILLAMMPVFVNAQRFELTPNGFVDADNPEKSYIVIPFEGKTQQEIYNLTLGAIGKIFVSPKDRVSNVEYSQINVNGFLSNVTYMTKLGIKYPYDLYYNLIFEFKEGRMKINGLNINEIVRSVLIGRPQFIFVSQNQIKNKLLDEDYIFYKNGKLCLKKQKERIETSVNELVSRIISLMNEEKDSDW